MIITTAFTFYTEPMIIPGSFEPTPSNPDGSTPNQTFTDEDGRQWIAGAGASPVPLKKILVVAKEGKLFMET